MQGYDCRGHALYGRLEKFAHAYLGRVHTAVIYLDDIQNAIACVQEHYLEILLF